MSLTAILEASEALTEFVATLNFLAATNKPPVVMHFNATWLFALQMFSKRNAKNMHVSRNSTAHFKYKKQ